MSSPTLPSIAHYPVKNLAIRKAGSSVLRWRVRRTLYLIAGFTCLALAVIGALLPVMPTTVFVIMAAWCFARSSPRLEAKLLNHPRFGPHIRAWREHGAVSRAGKWAATVALAISASLSFVLATLPWPFVSMAAAVMVGGWLWTRPES